MLPTPSPLCVQADVLEAWLRQHLGWDFRMQMLGEDDEDDEDGPVMVELTEEQAALISL